MTTLSLVGNPNYAARVLRVNGLVELPGLDNLRGVSVDGFMALVSKDTPVGSLVVAFVAESQLSDEFLSAHNLYRHQDRNQDQTQAGYIEDNRRVRAVKFRGHMSSALIMDASILGVTDDQEGALFDTIDGVEISRKYYVKRSSQINAQARQIAKAFKRVDEKMLPEHFDTANWFRNKHLIPDDAYVTVTQKIHGCLAYNVKVLLEDGTQRKIGELVREGFSGKVMGVDTTGRLVPTTVTHVFDNGKNPGKWFDVKVCGKRAGKNNRTSLLCVTENHRFLSPSHPQADKDGYVGAEYLSAGDTLYSYDHHKSLPYVADKFFTTVAPYIPESMSYKLPVRFQCLNTKVSVPEATNEIYAVQVLSVKESTRQSRRYDLETETHNFIAGGIVVHNSSIRMANTIVLRKLSWFERVLKKFGVRVQETEYDVVFGSRKVIRDPHNPDQKSFYEEDLWTREGEKYAHLIPKNVVVYAELIGWVGENSPIQGNYTYSAQNGTADLYVYRVAVVTADGGLYDLSWTGVKQFCAERGLNHVVELWAGLHSEFVAEDWLDRKFYPEYPHAVPLSKDSPVDEGVVVRWDGLVPTVLKLKSPIFLGHETLLADKDVVDIESEEVTNES